MKYNFDEIIPRRHTNSYKWDSAPEEGVLPMWVADMDFRTAPAIIDALRRRVEHGIFGYTRVPDEYYTAVASWFSRRHGWHGIRREDMIYTSGVVPAISAIIKALTPAGSKVIVQTPVYNCFFSSIRNNGCEILDNPLIYEDRTYRMDFEDLERKAADPDAKLLLLCNPHNPAGRVWTREELTRLGEICMLHGVTVVSDEIHCELVFPEYHYTPYASISDAFMQASITCCSPTKAFNIAGLQIANIICRDDEMRAKIDKAININEVCDVNPFGVIALQAAYNESEDWLEELILYLKGNYEALLQFFADELPQYLVCKLEGTYLVWVDFSSLGITSEELEEKILESEKLWLNCGAMYGKDGFMRINIACPRSVMLEGLRRLQKALSSLPRH